MIYRNMGYYSHYFDQQGLQMYVHNPGQHTNTSNILEFMFKLHRYGKIDGVFQRYAKTLQVIIRGIDENRMIVSESLHNQYVRVLQDIDLFIELYNRHELYINDFIIEYEERNVVLYNQEGRDLYQKCLGGLAFVQLDEVMFTLRLD